MADIDTTLMLRLEASISRFEKQMRQAQAVARQTTTGVQADFDRLNGRIGQTSAQAASGLMRIASISGRGRFVLQNTAAQLGDIAVQMQAGTAASRVMAQQLPQLLGGFGALNGALGLLGPLFGTLAAIGIPVVAMLMRNGDAADEAAEKVKTFEESLKAAQSALSAAQSAMINVAEGGLDDLVEKYGQVTERVKALAAELYAIEARAAAFEVNALIDQALGPSLTDELDRLLGDVGGALVGATADEAQKLRDLIAQLSVDLQNAEMSGALFGVADPIREQLAEAQEQLAAVEGRFADIGSLAAELRVSPQFIAGVQEARAALEGARAAGDFSGIADALARYRGLLLSAGQAVEQGVLDKLTQAEDAARQLAAQGERGKAALEALGAVDVSSNLAAGAAAAQGLTSALGAAVAAAQRLAATSMANRNAFLDDNQQYSGRGSGLYEMGLAPAYVSPPSEPPPIVSSGGGGGGGGGASEIDRMASAFETLRGQLDPAWAGLQKMAEAQSTLNWALAQGLITLPEFEALMAAANDKFRDGTQDVNDYAQALGNALGGFLVDFYQELRSGESAWGAFKAAALNAMDAIAQEALRMAAMGVVQAIFGTGAPAAPAVGGGGVLGALFGGLSGARANGGPVAAGHSYLVGERGPEIFTPRMSGAITPNGAAASITVNINGNLPRGAVRQSGGRVDIDMGRMVAAAIGGGAADGALRGRFGLAPRGSGA